MENLLDRLKYFGATHKFVNLSDRELFSLSEEEISICYEKRTDFNLNELFIISTCGRTEFYAYSSKKDLQKFIKHIYNHFNKPCKLNSLSYLKATESVKQLINVSCGIESQLIGETEITNQVKKSFQLSKDLGASKTVLTKLVQTSLEAGKKARTQTKISDGSLSISYAAIEKISSIVTNLKDKKVLVIGAGITGESVALKLKNKCVNNIFISNRTEESGIIVSNKVGAKFIKFDDYQKYLHKMDIVITCTSAQYNLITTREVISTLEKNPSLLLMDLSLPRNIEKSADYIPNAKVLTLDDVNDILRGYFEIRKKELPKVNQIVEEKVIEYVHWLYQLKVTPTISNLKHYYEDILDLEISKIRHKHDEKTINSIKLFSKSLIKRYLKEPITFLKSETNSEDNKRDYINLLRSIHKFK